MSAHHALWQPRMFHSRCGQPSQFLHPRSRSQTTSKEASVTSFVRCYPSKRVSARMPLDPDLHARQPGTKRRCVRTHSTAAKAALTTALQHTSGLWRLWAALICVAALGFQSERYRIGRELSGCKSHSLRSTARLADTPNIWYEKIFATQNATFICCGMY